MSMAVAVAVAAGFKTILKGMNAERVLIAAECIGDGRYFTDKVAHQPCLPACEGHLAHTSPAKRAPTLPPSI